MAHHKIYELIQENKNNSFTYSEFSLYEKLEEALTLGYDFNEILDNCRNIRILLIGDESKLSRYFSSYRVNQITIVESVYQKNIISPDYDMVIYDNSLPEYEEDVNGEIKSLTQRGIASMRGKKIYFTDSPKKILVNSLEYVVDNFPMLSYYICIHKLIKKGVKVYYFSEPTVYQIKNRSKHEEYLASQNFSSPDILTDPLDYCKENYPYDWDDLI